MEFDPQMENQAWMELSSTSEMEKQLEDVQLDSVCEGFLSGSGGTANLQAHSHGRSFSNSAEVDPEAVGAPGDRSGDGASAEASAAAAAAATSAAAIALMGGRLAEAQSIIGNAFGAAFGSMATVAVPTSLQPVKERAGLLLSKARPWHDFIYPLSVPTAEESCSRITLNLHHFQANYAILFVATLVLTILLQPSALICIALTVVAWMLFLKKNEDPDWQPAVGGVQLGPMQRWLALACVTAVLLLFFVGGAIFNTTLLYVFLAGIHGVVHDASSCCPHAVEDVLELPV